MSERRASVLFLGKKNDLRCKKALEYCRQIFTDVDAYLGDWGDPLPDSIHEWNGDFIFSYLARWILPERILRCARIAGLNFHAASPEYPGVGGNNFALYEGVQEYGLTCHHMAPRVDSGSIVAVKRFPLFPSDSVASLLERIYDYQLVFFYEIVGDIALEKPLPVSEERWRRQPFTRKQLNGLFEITLDMPEDEINRRIKATSFGLWQPWIRVGNCVFEYKPQNEKNSYKQQK